MGARTVTETSAKLAYFDDSNELFTAMGKLSGNNYSVSFAPDSGFCEYTFNETMQALNEGYDVESMAYDKRALDSLISDESETINIQYDVTGQYVDMGAFVSGVPECMASFEMLPSNKPILNIYVNTSASCGISEDTIKTRGIAIASLLDVLIRDYNVNLYFEQAFNYKGTNYIGRFHVPTDNGISFNQLAFYSAHSGMLRRFGFGVMEQLADEKYCGNYGLPCNIKHNDNDIVFNSLFGKSRDYPQWDSLASAKNEVTRIIKSITNGGEK